EDAGADIGAEGLRRHEHATLHHQLREADTAQKRRFAATVGALIITSSLSSAFTSLSTTRSFTLRLKQMSYRPVAENAGLPAGTGCGKQTGSPFSASRSRRFRQPM